MRNVTVTACRRITLALAACALAACAAAPTPNFSGEPGGARSGACVEDCRLVVINQTSYRVVVSAYHGSVLRQLGVLAPSASQGFTVPRRVRTVVAEVAGQEFCRGPVRWRTDGSADFIVGGPSCSAVARSNVGRGAGPA